MSKQQHTPGPWKAVIQSATFAAVDTVHDCRICSLDCESADCESADFLEADARLIAAAPDLLAMLKRIRELDDAGMVTPDGMDCFPILSAADRKALDAAIAAAEGGAK